MDFSFVEEYEGVFQYEKKNNYFDSNDGFYAHRLPGKSEIFHRGE